MLLRLGLGALAVAGAFVVACSSDDSPASSDTPVADAGAPNDAGSNVVQPANDGGNPADAASEAAATPAQPITGLKEGQWLWVPFPDSSCANGTATGIGVNLGTSKRVVLYLEGGGACWNALTCYTAQTAADLDGFDQTKFEARTGEQSGSELDRTLADNPFKDDSFVYVPYCTGDVHAGNAEQTYAGAPNGQTTKHYGRRNLDAFLARLVPTFADATRVFLTGASAGGFGTAVNYERVRKAFGGTLRVDMIDDSGPPFPNADIASYADWSAAWDLPGAYPAGCNGCATDLTKVLPYYATTYPDARFALLSFSQDNTIRTFFGTLGNEVPAATFQTELEGVIGAQLDPTTNAKAYEISGTAHTMLGALDTTTSEGKKLSSWLTDMTTDSQDWATVKLDH